MSKSLLDYLRLAPDLGVKLIASWGARVNLADELANAPFNIARGRVPGAEPFSAFGERTTTGVETDIPIWPNGAIKLPGAAGARMSVVSTSVADAAGGTGVRELHMHYLDAQRVPHEEIIPLDGTTPVLTDAKDILFIQCMHVHSVGSGAVAAGRITASVGFDIYSEIAVGKTRCTSSFRMVPKGKRLFISGAVGSSVSATADTTTVMRLVANSIGTHQYEDPLVWIPHASIGEQNGSIGHNFLVPFPFNEGDIVGFTHSSSKAVIVSGTWFGHLEDAQ